MTRLSQLARGAGQIPRSSLKSAAVPLAGRPPMFPINAPFTVGSKTLTGSSAQILGDDEHRAYLLLVNFTAGTIFFDFGRPATDKSIPIVGTAGNGSYEAWYIVPSNSVNVLGTGVVIYATARLRPKR